MAVTKTAPKAKAAVTKEKDTKKKPVQKSGGIDKEKKARTTVPKDFEVDEAARYSGTCVYFNRKGGFGFIKLSDSDVVPEDKVMVHWKEIKTEDRWQYLVKGLDVEFGLKKQSGKGGKELRAKEVTLPGGEPIQLQDEREEKLEYVGDDKNMRYTGKVKFFDHSKGFGYVILEEGYDIPAEVPQEFRIDREEVNAGPGEAPRLNKDMEIEFGISKNKKNTYSAFNITLPGGEVITRNVTEGRKEASKQTYEGSITMWAWQKGFGWILPDAPEKFSKEVKTALAADSEKRKKKAEKKGKGDPTDNALYFRRGDLEDMKARPSKGNKVTFKVYVDDQGVGACAVTLKA